MPKKSDIDARKIQILGLVVREYIRSGEATGSKSLVRDENMEVSSATVRNDMKQLEEMGLIYQPYNSAGRLPTTRGIRMYVDYLMEVTPQRYLNTASNHGEGDFVFYDDRMYDMVSELSQATGELAFLSSSESQMYCIAGISTFLQKHSSTLAETIFPILNVVENRTLFSRTIANIAEMGRITICIGEENILPELEVCSLMVAENILG